MITRLVALLCIGPSWRVLKLWLNRWQRTVIQMIIVNCIISQCLSLSVVGVAKNPSSHLLAQRKIPCVEALSWRWSSRRRRLQHPSWIITIGSRKVRTKRNGLLSLHQRTPISLKLPRLIQCNTSSMQRMRTASPTPLFIS